LDARKGLSVLEDLKETVAVVGNVTDYSAHRRLLVAGARPNKEENEYRIFLHRYFAIFAFPLHQVPPSPTHI